MIATKEKVCWVDWENRVISFRDFAHAELRVFEEREKICGRTGLSDSITRGGF